MAAGSGSAVCAAPRELAFPLHHAPVLGSRGTDALPDALCAAPGRPRCFLWHGGSSLGSGEKTCLDTDVIEIQISLKAAYLQTCPALEPASPVRTRCRRQCQEGCTGGVK